MAKQAKTAISPTREENYPDWYQQVIKAADLAENSPVRGCMVIKPWGYALWENIQKELDKKFKETGHENAYFPLFIPKSYIEKEAQHVEGFAKECAVVTHSRLEHDGENGLRPAGELEEPLIVRPTSETIIGEMYAKWVESYRDLPIMINQWANVVRWELRTRLFLRTAEFLWQEGHTAHATKEEAMVETKQMLQVYADFARDYMAMPVFTGEKTESERFPGADQTLCIEAMMQDRKALQAGTSHFLGQNFAKSCNIQFLNAEGEREHAWTTSWGVSTRLIGGLIMTHSDDDGLIVPPKLAPTHIVILPVLHKPETADAVLAYCQDIASELRKEYFCHAPLSVKVDTRDLRGGEKTWSWVKKGVPLLLEIGPRDVESGKVFMSRRDDRANKQAIDRAEFISSATEILENIQQSLYARALSFQQEHTRTIESKEEFYAFFTPKNENKPEIHGGFVLAHWNGSAEVEEQIKKDLKVTIRCIPDSLPVEAGTCIFTGEPSAQRVLFAKAY